MYCVLLLWFIYSTVFISTHPISFNFELLQSVHRLYFSYAGIPMEVCVCFLHSLTSVSLQWQSAAITMTDAMILVAIKKMIVMSSFRPASQKFAEMFRKRLESQRVSRVSVKKPLFFFQVWPELNLAKNLCAVQQGHICISWWRMLCSVLLLCSPDASTAEQWHSTGKWSGLILTLS